MATNRDGTTRAPKKRRDWKSAWLAAFERHGTVSAACRAADIGRSTVYEARTDEAFAQAWDDIESETTDRMEREAYRRAVEGFEQGEETRYSDTLLIFLLKARKPGAYRDNMRVEHSGPDGRPLEVVSVEASGDHAAEVARILARTRAVSTNGDGSNGHHP